MHSMKSIAALLCLTAFALGCGSKEDPTPVQPGGSTAWKISGNVTDAATGAVVVGALISTIPPTQSVTTNADGDYVIENVPAGTYSVIANKLGYRTGNVSVAVVSSPITANIVLMTGSPNSAPRTPSNPLPADGALGVPYQGVHLSWTGGDVDGGPVAYDVYFGTSNPPTQRLSRGDSLAATDSVGQLTPSTTYYWSVVAHDDVGGTTSGPVWKFTTADPPPPYAVLLDSGGISVPAAPDLDLSGGSFTIEAWVRPDRLPAESYDYQWIINKSSSNIDLDYLLGVNDDGHFRFLARGTMNDLIGPRVEPGTLYHVVGVLDVKHQTIMLYVDDVIAAQQLLRGVATSTPAPLSIGSRSTSEFFNGVIDEVRIWNVARTQQQISEWSHGLLKGNEPGLVAYWRFDEKSGAMSPDITGHGHGASLNEHVKRIPSPFPLN